MRKAVIGGVVVVAVIAVIVAAVMVQRSTSPVFQLIDHNWDLDTDFDEEFNPIYTVTIYVKVKNNGIDGTDTVVCEVTREDLSKIKKSQSVFIASGQTKVLEFVFGNAELKGALPKEYRAWVN